MSYDRPNGKNPAHKICFVLEPHWRDDGDNNQPEQEKNKKQRERENNLIFEEIIEPAVAAHGYRVVRSSHLCQSGYVTREHQRLAEEAELVIANLTHDDPVAYFCLAWRLGKTTFPDLLVLLHEGADRLIEAPVLNVPPVLYNLTIPAEDPQTKDSERIDSYRRNIQLSRNNLTRQVKQLVDVAALRTPQPSSAIVVPPTQTEAPPTAQPQPPVGTGQVVDEIMRQLLRRMDGNAGTDIVDRLSATLLRQPKY